MNRLMKMAGFMPVILGTLCACQSASTERYDIANKEDLYKNLPFEMPVVQHPFFPTIRWISVISAQRRTVRH